MNREEANSEPELIFEEPDADRIPVNDDLVVVDRSSAAAIAL
jgi:hypothetical protein